MERPRPAGHEPQEELAGAGRRLLDAEVERGEHVGGAVAREELGDARVGEAARRHHRARVALHHVGHARVPEEDPVGLLVEAALAHDADGRHEDALVVDLRRVRRDAARPRPADVLVVAEGHREGDDGPVVEDGRAEDHVLVVLDGAVGQIRIVEPVRVAGAHGLDRILPEDGRDHARSARGDVRRHHAARLVVEADEVVLLLLDEGRHRAPLHQELHLEDGRVQRAADDLERDGVDGQGRAHGGAL